MNNSIEIAKELKKELDNLPLFQEYERIRKFVENDQELSELKTSIALAKAKNDIEQHQLLLNRYNNHPLIVNLSNLESEVADYLKEISKIVNKK